METVMVPLTKELLAEISGAPVKRLTDELLKCLNRTMVAYGITTIKRQAHFLAQIIHESGAFRYTEEIASGSAYEGRLDLGNTEPGDGARFKGRAHLQLTGRGNYTQYSVESGVDFIANPEKLAELPYACTASGWFWKTRGLNELADEGDVRKVTRRINGGYNGLPERIRITEKAERALTGHREKTMRRQGKMSKVDLIPVAPLPTSGPSVPTHLEGHAVAPVVAPERPSNFLNKRPKWIGLSKVTVGVLIGLMGVFGVHIPYAKEVLGNWDVIFTSVSSIVGAVTAIYGRFKADRPVTLLPPKKEGQA